MTTYTEKCSRNSIASSVGALDILIAKISRFARYQLLKTRIKQERRHLAEMSESMLRDLGIDRAAAEQEAQRTDVPTARLKNL